MKVIKAAILVVAMYAGGASATTLTVIATGSVYSTDNLDGFAIGDQFTLTYDIDTSASDFNPDDFSIGDYRTAGTNVRVQVADYQATALTGGVRVINHNGSPTIFDGEPDSYVFGSGQCRYAGFQFCDSFAGPDVNSRFPFFVEFSLKDPTRTAFLSDALPAFLPPVAAFPSTPILDSDGNNHLILSFATENLGGNAWAGVLRVKANVTSVAVVPVPAAVWLFGSALGLLGWLRRK
ncbi:MAG: hypothetical protein IT486_08885 [Gammaproteobacteria bacterium]|nr:hypothetical protein [Gammaproteobacteria bacterium]